MNCVCDGLETVSTLGRTKLMLDEKQLLKTVWRHCKISRKFSESGAVEGMTVRREHIVDGGGGGKCDQWFEKWVRTVRIIFGGRRGRR